MVAGTYDDVSEFLDMRVESQLEEGAAMLVGAVADWAANRGLSEALATGEARGARAGRV